MGGNFRVGHWLIQPGLNTISNNGTDVQVEPKVMEVLVCLASRPGDSLSKETIIKAVWPDTFVSDDALIRCVSELRRVFEDDARAPVVIQTIPKRGYRLLAPVHYEGATDMPPGSQIVARSPDDTMLRRSAVQVLRGRQSLAIVASVVVVLAAFGLWRWKVHRAQMGKLTDKDTIVLADFANSTGDVVFDDTLKTALSIALHQSPFLDVLSENKLAATLTLMMRPSDTKLSPDIARELCQRAGSKAYIAGSIASLGSQYVLALKAVNCQTGSTLAQDQVTAAAKENVLDALGKAASKLRGQLGESLLTVQKLDVPLSEATTPSLEALRAYSLGEKALRENGEVAALSYHERAIEHDPNFAMGYRAVAADYFGMGEVGRATDYYKKAFQLRDHASEREKLQITANYYQNVTGELDKAARTLQDELQTYPREYRAHLDVGLLYAEQGQYEKSLESYREALRLAPDNGAAYDDLAYSLLALQQFQEARQTIQHALARELDGSVLHAGLYALAFLATESSTMTEQQQWFAGTSEEDFGLSLASDSEAYAGHLGKARDLTRRSVDSAIRADSKENGAIWEEIAAQREAAFGNFTNATQAAKDGLKLVPGSRAVEAEAALAFAMSGAAGRAESLAQNLNKRFLQDTQMQSVWLPSVKAQLALRQHDSALALKFLQIGKPIELGQISFVANISCLYPTYFRAEAFLAAGQGNEAAAEFQKILEHNGIVWNCWTGALAHLGLARANALQARNSHGADADAARAKALAAYDDFLLLWKDADPDIPLLHQAKAEYARLQAIH